MDFEDTAKPFDVAPDCAEIAVETATHWTPLGEWGGVNLPQFCSWGCLEWFLFGLLLSPLLDVIFALRIWALLVARNLFFGEEVPNWPEVTLAGE